MGLVRHFDDVHTIPLGQHIEMDVAAEADVNSDAEWGPSAFDVMPVSAFAYQRASTVANASATPAPDVFEAPVPKHDVKRASQTAAALCGRRATRACRAAVPATCMGEEKGPGGCPHPHPPSLWIACS